MGQIFDKFFIKKAQFQFASSCANFKPAAGAEISGFCCCRSKFGVNDAMKGDRCACIHNIATRTKGYSVSDICNVPHAEYHIAAL